MNLKKIGPMGKSLERLLSLGGGALLLALSLITSSSIGANADTTILTPTANYSIPTAQAGPDAIVAEADGSLWFSEAAAGKIGHLDSLGVLHEFQVPTSHAMPTGLTVGPDGNLWFVEETASQIGYITPSGLFKEFVLPAATWPAAITVGSDKALWFTQNGANSIGRITTQGAISSYPVPTLASHPLTIVAGPDGNLWFTENAANKIAKITPSGVVTEYTSPTPIGIGLPMGIAVGADNRIWFISAPDRVAAVSADGQGTEYYLPSGSFAIDLVRSPSGVLW